MWYKYIMEYYSAIKRSETSPFAAIWMDLEDIMLGEISQTEKTSTVQYHLHVESKKVQLVNIA